MPISKPVKKLRDFQTKLEENRARHTDHDDEFKDLYDAIDYILETLESWRIRIP